MQSSLEQDLLPGLPDELAVHCLLRLSRLVLPITRCVCRRWLRLFSSPPFFHLRAQQRLSQEWLHIVLRDRHQLRCFAFVEEEPRAWMPLPPLPHQRIGFACVVAARKLYILGGSQGGSASKCVWSFDPVWNRWEERAPMRVSREFAAAGLVSGHIYVMGGCLPGSSSWAEVFDPLTDVWDRVPSPLDKRYKWMHGNVVLHDKLYAVGDMGGIIFDPRGLSWEPISMELDHGWRSKAAVVCDVLFSCDNLGKILGYVEEENCWYELRGWESEMPRVTSGAMLTNVAGKLYVLWELSQHGWERKVGLASLEISRAPNLLMAKVLWCHVSMLSGSAIHTLSLAL